MTPRFFECSAATGLLLCLAGCGGQPPAEQGDGPAQAVTAEAARQAAEATRLLDRGIGLMDQFDFAAAAEAFGEAGRINPASQLIQVNHAIALLNTAIPGNLDQARRLLKGVLENAPNDPYAHFCLGIIALHRNELADAQPHFRAVATIDPTDPSGWYHLGLTRPPGSAEATECFERALEINPNLTAAMHGLAMNLRRTNPDRARSLLTGQQALLGAEWDEPLRIRYAEMGRYGNVIVPGLAVGTRPPPIRSSEPPPALEPRFAAAELMARLEPATAVEPMPAVSSGHSRFGSVLLPLAVESDGSMGLLVLDRGRLTLVEPDEAGRFHETTARHPGLVAMASEGTAIAAAVGDFDNDGRGDLAITTGRQSGAVRLLRNDPERGFIDVTDIAGVPAVGGPAVTATWLDLDQDGDLDLVLARPADAAGTAVLLNTSIAPAAVPNAAPPPLEPRFREENLTGLSGLPAATVLTSDLDDDRDLDLLLLGTGQPQLIWNDRLLRFHSEPLLDAFTAAVELDLETLHAGLVIDLGADGLFERLLLRQAAGPLVEGAERTLAESGLPPLLQAAAGDFDLDGLADLAGLTPAGMPIVALARQDSPWLLADIPKPADPHVAVCPADLDGDGGVDLVTLSASGDLAWLRNTVAGRRAVRLVASGRRDRATSLRTNADGIGVRAIAIAGPLLASCENTTLAAGLGQPRLPLHLGIGRAEQADVVRLVWPDGVPQAELDVPADRVVRIEETSRKTTSCPVLFVWTGEKFSFVTDFLGGGVTGETLPDGSVRPPRPQETVLVRPPPIPVLEDGQQTVRLLINEPFDEVLYLDGLRLVVCDHPTEWAVVADERFPAAGPPPTGDLLVAGPALLPDRVVNESGSDVTGLLSASDGRMTAPPRPRSWLGYAKPHAIDLEFRSGIVGFAADQPVVLELDGWTDYPYPESMWAAEQAGIGLEPPRFGMLAADGASGANIDVGFFAGLPRVMGLIIDGEILGRPPGVFRLETAMQIGWDRIALRPLLGRFSHGDKPQQPVRHNGRCVTHQVLPLIAANLRYGGLAAEVDVGSRGLVAYDLATRDPVAVSRWQGGFGQPGNVTRELAAVDRQLVICGPGFDVDCKFDAGDLPALPAGYRRSWFLEANGITRDTSPLTAGAGLVYPIPAFE